MLDSALDAPPDALRSFIDMPSRAASEGDARAEDAADAPCSGKECFASSTVVSVPAGLDQGLLASTLEARARHWMRLIQARDESGLRQLYSNCRRRVFLCALGIVRRDDLASEIVSTSFMQVWTNAASFDPQRGNFLAWLTLIARSRSFDALRRLNTQRQHEVSSDDEEPFDVPDGEAASLPLLHLERLSRQRRLRRAMSRLSSIQRQVVCLTSIDGLSHDEVSRHLNLPLGTVKSHAKRALAALRQRCEASGLHADA
jgi:RNA polymerase sigma-70 factor (ECF subfamily)